MVVVVVGEDPYAEGGGDRAELALDTEDRALIDAAKRTGKPMVVVLLSGRPLILGDIVDAANGDRRRLAARHRGRGRRRRAHRRGQADRQAVVLAGRATMADDPDQRRRREVRSAVPVRPRPELVSAMRVASSLGVSVAVAVAGGRRHLRTRRADAARGAHERRVLDGPWSFHRVTPRKDPPEPWLPATVPGCVHTDLFANGKIGDPFYRLNEKDQQWIERESWEYRTILRADAATAGARARRAGVRRASTPSPRSSSTAQTVLFADNMFRSWRADVKAQLHAGDNVIVVRFRSPIEQVQGAYRALGYRLPGRATTRAPEMVSMWARKAPYHYGWDWGPRFVTSGIWRPVTLETWDEARIDDVQIFQNQPRRRGAPT